jgi:hypothetical protein
MGSTGFHLNTGAEVRERHPKLPPTFAFISCTLQVNPFGGSHFASASASRNAR